MVSRDDRYGNFKKERRNREENERSVREVKKWVKNEHKFVKDESKYWNKDVKDEKKYNKQVYDTSPPPLDQKEKPNFEPSGLLAAETNQRNGIQLKYCVPDESVMPDLSWRLYIFKPENDSQEGKNSLIKVVKIDEKEFYLIGKDHRIVDINLFHPTISKQHAVIQFRQVDDSAVPYLIDLESTNGTFINDERIESSKYYELRYYPDLIDTFREKDIIKFGLSTREYVLLNDKST